MEKRPLLFLHIPKTGGMTLRDLFSRQYPASRCYFIPNGPEECRAMENLNHLFTQKDTPPRVVGGHHPFGFHCYIPVPAVYFTVVRDPVERIISHYQHVVSHPQHYLHRAVVARSLGLKEYVQSGISKELDNDQVRKISGMNPPLGQCTQAMLEKAKENIRNHFLLVGLTERFAETVWLLKKLLGWKGWPFYLKHNVSSDRRRRSTIPLDIVREIEDRQKLDRALYRYVQQRFEALIRSQRIAFKAEVQIFKVFNGFYRFFRLDPFKASVQ